MVIFNLVKYPAAQDMIQLIKTEKKLSEKEAVDFAISIETYNDTMTFGWRNTALDLWGHGEPDREWGKLDNPIIEIDLESEKLSMLNKVAKKLRVNHETALSYFLLFTMNILGYHI